MHEKLLRPYSKISGGFGFLICRIVAWIAGRWGWAGKMSATGREKKHEGRPLQETLLSRAPPKAWFHSPRRLWA